MKPLITTIALTVAFTAPAVAQKFEVGFNTGLSANSALLNRNYSWKQARERYNTFDIVTPAYSVSAGYRMAKWQADASVGYNGSYISVRKVQPFPVYASLYYNLDPVSVENSYWRLANSPYGFSYVSARLFVNRTILQTSKTTFYAGLSGGIGSPRAYYYRWGSKGNKDIYVPDMLLAGVRAGGTWYPGKHIGFNAELAGDYVGKTKITYLLSYSLTTGIRFRF